MIPNLATEPLGPHHLGAVQRPRQRQPVERDLAPVGAPAGDDPEQLLGGLAGAAQVLHDACGLAVERDQGAGPRKVRLIGRPLMRPLDCRN